MATVPSLAGFTVGERVTAAKLTGHTKTAVDFLLSPPIAKIHATAAQSIPTGTSYTTATFSTTAFDNDAMADLPNNQLVIKTAGKYLVQAAISYATNATGGRNVAIALNGAAVPFVATTVQAATGLNTQIATFDVVQLAVNDTLRVYTLQTSGGNLNTGSASGGAFQTRLMAQWVGI